MVQNGQRAEGSTPTQARRVWTSSFLGSVIEFYDFSIYATASALVLAPLFFSEAGPGLGQILAFATLAIGYVARPIGAMIFGHFGDRIGRKSTLIATIVLMAVSTFLIGCVPTTAQIGQLAPVLLVLLRLLQGISVGGEWGGGVTLSTEHSTARRRGLMGSATLAGSAGGVLLGFVAFAVIRPLSGDSFLTWGWRVPFLFTVVLFGLAFYMRLRVHESPLMSTTSERDALPIKTTFVHYPGALLRAAGIGIGPFIMQQVLLTFFIAYPVSNLGVSQADMVNASIVATVINVALIPLAGLLTDRIGRRRVLLIGLVLQLINAFLVAPMISTGDYGLILASFALVAVFHVICFAPLAALLAESFPSRVRYTGVSVSYQLASLVGGFGPLIASLLMGAGLGLPAVTTLLVVGLALSLGCALLLPRSNDIDLARVGEDTPGPDPDVNPTPRAVAQSG